MACESVVLFPESSEKKYILPFGFVQSAIIASLCLSNSSLGKYLNKLESNGVRVSVYMDDIIVSTPLPMRLAEEAFFELQEKSIRSGFDLNTDKTFGPRDKITAFNISLSKEKIEITGNRFAEFKNRLLDTNNKAIRDGILGYIETVCPIQASVLMKFLDS